MLPRNAPSPPHRSQLAEMFMHIDAARLMGSDLPVVRHSDL